MFPVACAGVQNINKNKDLTEQEVNILYSVVDDFDNQRENYDWKSAVQTISGVASRFVAKSNSKNNQIAMPLLIQQMIFFMAVRGEDYKLYKQTELMYEFTGKVEYNPEGKYVCNNNTTLNIGKIFSKLPYDYKYYRSCRDYKFEYKSLSGVAYSQPAILFSYNGQKDKELGAVIRNLAYQAGKYKHFVDVFGGTGSATLAVPKRGYAFNQRGYVSYIYNDLDERLVNLYNVIKSDDYKILVDEMNQLKLALSYGSTFDESIDFDKEMNKFFTKDTGININNNLSKLQNIVEGTSTVDITSTNMRNGSILFGLDTSIFDMSINDISNGGSNLNTLTTKNLDKLSGYYYSLYCESPYYFFNWNIRDQFKASGLENFNKSNLAQSAGDGKFSKMLLRNNQEYFFNLAENSGDGYGELRDFMNFHDLFYYVIPALKDGNDLVDMFDQLFGMYTYDDCSLTLSADGKWHYNNQEFKDATDFVDNVLDENDIDEDGDKTENLFTLYFRKRYMCIAL